MSGSESATRGLVSAGELSGPRCILPGCGNGAEEQGMPCGECADAFGSHLRQTEGPAMTVEAQAKRDNETQAAYVVLLAGGDPARVAAPSWTESAGARTPVKDPARKANQRCWLCEERRTCTRQVHGWECDVCRQVR
ncbi:hypothetical protein A7U43_27710 (plasmid) [Mycobacterium adipatum]|uniref:Uncharacterized protein n=1 Tax=Mycobacterium adipatum TaxID=1682113 RepID=A0A172UWW6_9MYCO|nr:hypothetical protein [Mycobacterium adipatum]ANE83525.1 hypothetical protein A7U43_27710 [Mycobacterium adipatum]